MGVLLRATEQGLAMSSLDEVADHLYQQSKAMQQLYPSSRWYFFGSFARGAQSIGDIDLLIICESSGELDQIRKSLEESCLQYPIHLMLMTHVEEAELNFIAGAGVVELGPTQPRPNH